MSLEWESPESLEPTKELIEKFVKGRNRLLIFGLIQEDPNSVEVVYASKKIEDLNQFLDYFIALKSDFLVLDEETISRKKVEEKIEELENGDKEDKTVAEKLRYYLPSVKSIGAVANMDEAI